MSERTYIIIHDGLRESIISDCVSVAAFVVMIGIGVLADSAAMQWTGALVFFMFCLGRAQARSKRMTLEEAREYFKEAE